MDYKLLTPGPLTTTQTVKQAMMVDHCTWDEEYKTITQEIRQKLLSLVGASPAEYTTILMQGSGSFGVESVLSSVQCLALVEFQLMFRLCPSIF